MRGHLLDDAIWNALSTRQANWAECTALAKRFPPTVGPLAALASPTPEAYDSLASLFADGEVAGLLLQSAPAPTAVWTLLEDAPVLQMVRDGSPLEQPTHTDYVELHSTAVPEMVALASLTQPGPFASRTHELGRFLGIRREGRLAAMAGIRLCLPGYTEVSGVCTHPDFLGRGYARSLINVLAADLLGKDEGPFLHVRSSNTRAIELYRRLGFQDRATFHFAVMRKAT
jgi:predicted GNAT family acetyltransferase